MEQKLEEPVSTLEWVVSQLMLVLPFINILLLLYWAFSSSTKASKRNYARSALVFLVPVIGLGIIAAIALPSMGLAYASAWEEEIAAKVDGQYYQANASLPAELIQGGRIEINRKGPAAPEEDGFRAFRDKRGREVMAKVIGFDGDKVEVMKRSGQTIAVGIEGFSDDDIAYLEALRESWEG